MSRSFSRETRHRNENHTNSRRYHRNKMSWKIGMLTNAYQYPESVSRTPAPSGVPYHVARCSAICSRHTQWPTV